MREIQAIVTLAQEAESGERMAMATVVRVEGSAYRRPGARMLITASGRTAGMISGGCLENDVRERAQQVMASGEPRVVTYDSTAPEDIVFGLGLGCSGVIRVLIEPVTAEDPSGVPAFLVCCQTQGQAGRAVTVFQAEGVSFPVTPGTRLLRWPDGRITGGGHPALTEALTGALLDPVGRGVAVRRIEVAGGGCVSALIETVAPPVPLVIFGAGEDAIPLAQFAKLLGWHVTVVDARPAYTLPERFPTADAVHCLRPEFLMDCPQIALSDETLAMIMTHSYTQDRELLRTLLPRGLRYVGLLGPKARTRRLLDELAEEGLFLSDDGSRRLYGPAGLDIGAETPEEVALSVLAEMKTALTGRSGGSLRERVGSIHETVERSGAVV